MGVTRRGSLHLFFAIVSIISVASGASPGQPTVNCSVINIGTGRNICVQTYWRPPQSDIWIVAYGYLNGYNEECTRLSDGVNDDKGLVTNAIYNTIAGSSFISQFPNGINFYKDGSTSHEAAIALCYVRCQLPQNGIATAIYGNGSYQCRDGFVPATPFVRPICHNGFWRPRCVAIRHPCPQSQILISTYPKLQCQDTNYRCTGTETVLRKVQGGVYECASICDTNFHFVQGRCVIIGNDATWKVAKQGCEFFEAEVLRLENDSVEDDIVDLMEQLYGTGLKVWFMGADGSVGTFGRRSGKQTGLDPTSKAAVACQKAVRPPAYLLSRGPNQCKGMVGFTSYNYTYPSSSSSGPPRHECLDKMVHITKKVWVMSTYDNLGRHTENDRCKKYNTNFLSSIDFYGKNRDSKLVNFINQFPRHNFWYRWGNERSTNIRYADLGRRNDAFLCFDYCNIAPGRDVSAVDTQGFYRCRDGMVPVVPMSRAWCFHGSFYGDCMKKEHVKNLDSNIETIWSGGRYSCKGNLRPVHGNCVSSYFPTNPYFDAFCTTKDKSSADCPSFNIAT